MRHVREAELDDAGRAALLRDLIRRNAYHEALALVTAQVLPSAQHAVVLLPHASAAQARLLARVILDSGELGEWLYRPMGREDIPPRVPGGRAPSYAHGALTLPLEEAVTETGEATLVLCGVEIPLLWDEQQARLFACDVAEGGLEAVLATHPTDQSVMMALEGARRYARGEINAAQLGEACVHANQLLYVLTKYRMEQRAWMALNMVINAVDVSPSLGDVCGIACLSENMLHGTPPLMTTDQVKDLLIAHYLGERP